MSDFYTKRFYALIPAYQPDRALPPLTAALQKAGFAVLVVDDGSGSAYSPVFDALDGAKVIHYPMNCGKGHAMKKGFLELATHAPDDAVVVTLDADGQHTAEDALRLAWFAAAQPAALSLGVRCFDGATPLRSRVGNFGASCLYRLCSGHWLGDTQTGMRACGVQLLPLLQGIPGDRYEYEMNVLLQAPRQGVALRTLPIETIYLRGNRTSHFNTVRDSVRILKDLCRFTAVSLASFGLDYGLFGLLTLLLGGLGAAAVPVANVAARVCSAAFNFAANRRYVFYGKGSLVREGLQYFALAAGILLGNTLLLSFLVNGLGANRYAAKLVTELTFFALSWLGQRLWIFKPRAAREVRHCEG